jgi:hypothetical protein
MGNYQQDLERRVLWCVSNGFDYGTDEARPEHVLLLQGSYEEFFGVVEALNQEFGIVLSPYTALHLWTAGKVSDLVRAVGYAIQTQLEVQPVGRECVP